MKPVLLGDPHLGRQFTKGVPLARRGEREQLVRADFMASLASAQGNPVHVCMGDLFDKPQVDYDTLLFAIQQYRTAASLMPGTTFYILQGNHDDSRDLQEVTAWDLFCDAMNSVQNVVPVVSPLIGASFCLFPWDPTVTAVEMLEHASKAIQLIGPTVAYGHWDVDPRSSAHNLIPTRELAALGITQAYTGHIHKPDQFRRDGVDVTVVGSMQPYAQGEDGDQSSSVKYVTLCINGLEDALVDGPDVFADACVRLRLQPGEQWEGEVPLCRSWQIERVRDVPAEAPPEVSTEGFDVRRAMQARLDEHEILPSVREQIDQRWTETFDGREG